jgi:hypothetical protein
MPLWRRRPAGVQAGHVYSRGAASRVKETAQVVAITNDRAGIPHVRFRLVFGRPEARGEPMEERTLALSAFMELYPERVSV